MSEINVKLYIPDAETAEEMPYYDAGISAGFPSPSDDYFVMPVDLNRELIRHPASPFSVRVIGLSVVKTW